MVPFGVAAQGVGFGAAAQPRPDLARARQASEQYFTSAQFFAQALRQLMGRAHTVHGLLGRWDLLPLNDGAGGGMRPEHSYQASGCVR